MVLLSGVTAVMMAIAALEQLVMALAGDVPLMQAFFAFCAAYFAGVSWAQDAFCKN